MPSPLLQKFRRSTVQYLPIVLAFATFLANEILRDRNKDLSEAIGQAEAMAVLNEKFEEVDYNISGIYEEITKVEDDAVQRRESRQVTIEDLLHPHEVNRQYGLILMDRALVDSRDLFTKISYDKTDDQRYWRLRRAIKIERDEVAVDLTLYNTSGQESPFNAELQSERAVLDNESRRDENDLGEPIESAGPRYVKSLILRAKREKEEKETRWRIGIYAGWFFSFLAWCVSLKMDRSHPGEHVDPLNEGSSKTRVCWKSGL